MTKVPTYQVAEIPVIVDDCRGVTSDPKSSNLTTDLLFIPQVVRPPHFKQLPRRFAPAVLAVLFRSAPQRAHEGGKVDRDGDNVPRVCIGDGVGHLLLARLFWVCIRDDAGHLPIAGLGRPWKREGL